MHPALLIAKTGLDAQNTNVRVIADNLANVETTGFKKNRAIFQDLMYQKIRLAGADNGNNAQLPSGLMLGTGARVASTRKDFSAGSPSRTDNNLDLSINGKGFFQILLPDGSIAYTRDGHFSKNAEGNMVNQEGLAIQPAINIPNDVTNVSVGKDGMITADTFGNAAPIQLGNIQLADFVNYTGLEPIGDNLYVETAASGTPQLNNPQTNGSGVIDQGYLESSNVNVVEELVNLIQAQRAYEINARAVETGDKMLQYLVQTI